MAAPAQVLTAQNLGRGYVLAWAFWFDVGTLEPRRYGSDTHQPADLDGLDGCLAGVALFADGTRRSIQGSEIYGLAPHPSGEPIFLQYGSGQMAPHEVEQAMDSVRRWYPGAALWLGKNAPDLLMKRAADAALSWKVE